MNEDFLPLDTEALTAKTGNIYQSVSIIGKRANQLTVDLKEELSRKLAEFAPAHDNLEEIVENREQIEISKYYERKEKPHQVAVHGLMNDEIFYRHPIDPEKTNAPDIAINESY